MNNGIRDGGIPKMGQGSSLFIRKIIFTSHLFIGLCVGAVIFSMALTGLALSFERSVTAWAERDVRFTPAAQSGSPRLGLGTLAQKVTEAFPDLPIKSLTLYADPRLAPFFDLGKGQVVYLNPYNGAVLGRGAEGWRSFFDQVTDFHRQFGFLGKSKDAARQFIGWCTLLFGFSVLSGIYLWWPRKWIGPVLKSIAVPGLKSQGKARDWNWHNAIGFWCAPWLLVIITTGLIMALPWASDLLYRVTGSAPPVRDKTPQKLPQNKDQDEGVKREGKSGIKKRKLADDSAARPLDAYLAAANQQCPGWISLNFKLPQKEEGVVSLSMEEAGAPNLYMRSQLILNAVNARVVDWEPYAGQNKGRQARSWARALHTGEAGGWFGQLLAALAVLGALFQVATGFSMAWRRFFGKAVPERKTS